MPKGTLLYGKNLFGNANESTIVKGMNNAPGSTTGGGVDTDVAKRLGFKDIFTKIRVAGTQKKDSAGNFRVQGICCGITAGWMAALLGGNKEATDHSKFAAFFEGPLRFQGAYIKDFKGNSSSIKTLFAGFNLKNSNLANTRTVLDPGDLIAAMPADGTWAGYLAAYHHAIGFGSANGKYYIMEPNAGLFEYNSKGNFASDLKELILTRKSKAKSAESSEAYFYTA